MHVSCVYRRGTQQGGLRIGRKTTNVTKFAQALKALAPMLVTGDGIARLANELHRLKAPTPMLATDDGISMLPTSCIHRKPRKPRLRCWRLTTEWQHVSFLFCLPSHSFHESSPPPRPRIRRFDGGGTFRNGKVHFALAFRRQCCCCFHCRCLSWPSHVYSVWIYKWLQK